MEKQGVVKEGVTPPAEPEEGEKISSDAGSPKSPADLDDNATKRLADQAAARRPQG